jgi:monovalent cation:H+ antiporter-2, CPA2 family
MSEMFALRALIESHNLSIVLLLTIAFTTASVLGYFAWRIKLSPILGYLLAGYLIGPYSPGFVVDVKTSEQLAEIGVILMMFGVGLDFRLEDLMKVKRIAIPGALGQTLIATILGAFVIYLFGWSLKVGIVLGLAIGVASTVVLVRILEENHLLKTQNGHIAVGWLIVEDVITVIILLLLPSLALVSKRDEFSIFHLFVPLLVVIAKFLILFYLLVKLGKKVVSYILAKIESTGSHELFTISLLMLIFVIALGATLFFKISIALGAFISGMIIKQTKVHQKVLLHSRPMKDAFIAIFFVSVGMLFNPTIIVQNISIFLSVLAIILLAKPLVAFLISLALKYPFKTALTVAIALAQIGEFSFILAEEAIKFDFMTDEGYDIIVACALASIALNSLFFKFLYTGVLKNKNSMEGVSGS